MEQKAQDTDLTEKISTLTRLNKLGISSPIMQAGMSGAAGPDLVAAVAHAGGIGTLGLHDISIWDQVINETKQLTQGQAFAVNLLLPYTRSEHVEAVIKHQVPIAVLFWGEDAQLIQHLKNNNIFVFQQIASIKEAQFAINAGVDGLIIQGVEAGGHVKGTLTLEVLLMEILKLGISIPIFAAGGIYTHLDAQRMIQLGASGVCTGTRFLMTNESNAHDAYKRKLLDANETIMTTLFGLGWPDPHRVVPNEATRKWCHEDGTISLWIDRINTVFSFTRKLLPMKDTTARLQRSFVPIFSPAMLLKGMPAKLVESTALYAGKDISRITSILPAEEVVFELAKGIRDALDQNDTNCY